MIQMTQAHNAQLEHRLGSLERRLRDDIRAALLQTGDQHHADIAGTVHDLGDESVANLLTDLGTTLYQRHLQELREIQAARRRLAEGSINRCVECGGDIGFERLLAYPIATRCIACQERHEHAYAHEASPRL